jgi:putative membrane protein
MTATGRHAETGRDAGTPGLADRASVTGSRRASIIGLRGAPWRVLAGRVVVNGLAVALVVLLLPGVWENTGRPVVGYLALGAIVGVINTVVKPLIQFVALPGLLGSMGLVLILVQVLTFWLLEELTPLLEARGLWAVVAAGVVLGLSSYVLDNVLGLMPPILREHEQEFAS